MLKLRDAVMTFKCVKGLAPPYLCDKFEMRSKTHNVTVDFNSLFTERFRTSEVRREVQKFTMKFDEQVCKQSF